MKGKQCTPQIHLWFIFAVDSETISLPLEFRTVHNLQENI